MAPLVDVHTHMYPPAYIDLLSNRTITPYIHRPVDPSTPPRLIILPSDDDPSVPPTQRGRPLDAAYSSLDAKITFMDRHRISASVLSLANPWLDFLAGAAGAVAARRINDDFDALCQRHPRRLFFFAVLPLGAAVEEVVEEAHRVQSELTAARGVILGTSGRGPGLDDPALDPLWAALAELDLPAFVHPHYGLPGEVFGPRAAASGHVLPLALGFPLETTIAFARLFLARVFDRHPRLQLLLAHAGGALPFLAGRIESCVLHEREFLGVRGRERRPEASIWEVLRRNVWLDGVVYSAVGLKAAVDAVGKERVLWGSDHPFFPPIGEDSGDASEDVQWKSVSMNVEAVQETFADDADGAAGVLGENAIRSFKLGPVGKSGK